MRGLRGLRPLRSAPALRELTITGVTLRQWEDYEPLKRHPTLERLSLYTGSTRIDRELTRRLGYPPALNPTDSIEYQAFRASLTDERYR